MPVYDYSCAACGPFTVLRPMAQFQDPHDCPDCGSECGRAFLNAPNLASMDAGRRKAFATNERSRHAPLRPRPRLRVLRQCQANIQPHGRQEFSERAALDDQPLTRSTLFPLRERVVAQRRGGTKSRKRGSAAPSGNTCADPSPACSAGTLPAEGGGFVPPEEHITP